MSERSPARAHWLPWAIAGAIAAAALALRLVQLQQLGLAFDEQPHIYAARAWLAQGAPVLPSGLRYDRAFAFTWLVAESMRVFGDHAAAARLPSALFGTGTVLLAFAFGRRLFGSGAGLLAAALLAGLPFELVWSRTCRMYAAYQFFYVLAAYAFYRGFEADAPARGPLSGALRRAADRLGWAALREPIDVEWLMVAGVAVAIAFHLQPLAALLGPAIALYAGVVTAVLAFTGSARGALRSKHALLALALSLTAGLLLLLPAGRALALGMIRFAPQWTQGMTTEVTHYLYFFNSTFLFPILIFFLIACVQACARLERGALFLVCCSAVPLAFHSVVARVQHPRYIYDFFPFIVLLCAYAGRNLFAGERERLLAACAGRWGSGAPHESVGRIASAALATAMALCFVIFPPALRLGPRIALSQGDLFGGPYNVLWTEACAFLAGRAGPRDVIATSNPLAADYAGCPHVDFNLDNGEIDQFLPPNASGLPMHAFAATPAIIDLVTFKRVLEPGKTFWLALDHERLSYSGTIPADLRAFVLEHFQERWVASDQSVTVFAWQVPAAGAAQAAAATP